MDLNQLIADNGACFYVIAFVWTFLEGETVVLFAGFAAAQGLVDPLLLLSAAWLGSFAGGQFYFWLGRNRLRHVAAASPAAPPLPPGATGRRRGAAAALITLGLGLDCDLAAHREAERAIGASAIDRDLNQPVRIDVPERCPARRRRE